MIRLSVTVGVMLGLCTLRPVFAEEPPRVALPKVRIGPDGRSFVTDDGKPFVPMGVNYFRPGTGWSPQVWKQFDDEATRHDFARMKSLGVNCVRVFLSYGSFFMRPDALLPEGLAKFDQFLSIAEAAGIYVHPTGPDHWEGRPAWAPAGNKITNDENYLMALDTFWRQFARRYRGRSVIFAYDLWNEPHVAWDNETMREEWNGWLAARYPSVDEAAKAWGVPVETIHWGRQPVPAETDDPDNRQLLDYQRFRESVADEWTRRQTAVIKQMDPEALVTVGTTLLCVPASAVPPRYYSAFRPQNQAKFLDFLEVHPYPYGETDFYQYESEEWHRRNLAWFESVVREMASTGKPVVLAEFGWYGGGEVVTPKKRYAFASEQQQAEWCRAVIDTTCGLATGWLNWGLYDMPEAPSICQRIGLLTADGSDKAWAVEFKRLSGSFAGRYISPAEVGPRPSFDWDRCRISATATGQFREQYYQSFLQEESSHSR